MKRLSIYVLALVSAFALFGCCSNCKKAERKIAVQTWTVHKMTLEDSFKLFNELGVKYTEICGGRIGGKMPKAHFGPNMSAAEIAYVKELLKKYNVKAISYGVASPKDDAGIKKVFELAKAFDMEFISSESDPSTFPIWEKYAQQYGIKMCVHNHSRHDNDPSYKFWDYNWVAKNVAPYKNIGACADNGAWECSGLNSVKGVETLKDKIFTVHLKDQKEFNVRHSPAVIYGTGVVDVAATIKALEKQGYDGYYIIEHGDDGDKRDIIAKDVAFIKNCK